MKALVTGANGFTGSHLVKSLLKQGYQVKGLVRHSSNLSRLNDCEIDLVYGDITDQEALTKAILGVDTVFHTAAYVELGLVDETEMERVNVQGTRAVLEVAQKLGISKLVHCSTIGVFGDTKGEIIDETFTRQQQHFSSAYDRTKYQAQKLVDNFAREGFPVVSVMPSGIFGSDDPHFTPVMKLFLERKLKFWVGGDRITGIVHVDDLVEAIILSAQRGKTGEYYIISTGELTTRSMFEILAQDRDIPLPIEVPEVLVRIIANLLDLIGRILDWNPPLSKERIHYIYERCVRVDGKKARQQLGWQPRCLIETVCDAIKT